MVFRQVDSKMSANKIFQAIEQKDVLLVVSLFRNQHTVQFTSYACNFRGEMGGYRPIYCLSRLGEKGEEPCEIHSEDDWKREFFSDDTYLCIWDDYTFKPERGNPVDEIEDLLSRGDNYLYISPNSATDTQGPLESRFAKWWLSNNRDYYILD